MTDKIQKSLAKFNKKELKAAQEILYLLKQNDIKTLNIVQLKGSDNIFRVRKGKIRVIFAKERNGNLKLLQISRRNESTYSDI